MLTMTDNENYLTLMELRKRTGLSQEAFAEKVRDAFTKIGSSRSLTKKSVSDWETGRHKPTLTPEETFEVCRLLNCSIQELAEASRQANVRQSVQ